MTKNDKNEKLETISIALSAALGLAVFLLVSYFAIVFFQDKSPGNPGEFGDMFGFANSVISGCAFIALIVAIFLQIDQLKVQKEDLKAQLEEIKENRKELAGQKEQLRLQNETFRKQSFESTFFQMLTLHNTIVNSIDVTDFTHLLYGEHSGKGKTLTGRDCFQRFFEELNERIENELRNQDDGHLTTVEVIGYLQQIYDIFYTKFESEIGHYFRNAYNLIKFIDKSQLSLEEKKFYVNIFRAQLSSFELKILFYNCISRHGFKKFKPLIEKYTVLKHISADDLNVAHYKTLYESSAFDKNKSVGQVPT